jgi:uncharacterized membrane protein
MAIHGSTKLWRALTIIVSLLIVKVTVEVMLGYVNYFPPNFRSDFLQGRKSYFFGAYRWAFYPHIVSGPLALFMGMLLLSESFRSRFSKWHRYLGRVHVANVLGVVTPSGLWMAEYASTGPIAAVGFAVLSVLTATCTAFGWRAAVRRKFPIHRRWMSRSFLLLCSAVVLRVVVGLGTVIGVQATWFDPLVSWSSWIVPLILFEWIGLRQRATPNTLAPPTTT